ncbi:MAG: ammonium transporter, partial [Candidatus Nitrosotenuis sp.]
MYSKNGKYALLLVTTVAIIATIVMTQAYAQQITDGMDAYVEGTAGIYTGNTHECWVPVPDSPGRYTPCMIDTGDTAWVTVATTLVLFMTPGVAFFYGGLTRSKNATNVIGMTFIVMGLISVQWVLWGYSLAFGPNDTEANKFMGALEYVGLNRVSHVAPLGSPSACTDQVYYTLRSPYVVSPEVKCSAIWPGTIPHQLFAMFQMTFAIITPALIVGGLIDRIKFSAFVVFILLWATFVYDPIAHWVWGGGFIGGGSLDLNPDLSPTGALDFAGGTVVHVSSGFSALAAALILGRRLGYGKVPMEPHNIPLVVLGTSMLWFGWFGFNAGSELA